MVAAPSAASVQPLLPLVGLEGEVGAGFGPWGEQCVVQESGVLQQWDAHAGARPCL